MLVISMFAFPVLEMELGWQHFKLKLYKKEVNKSKNVNYHWFLF